MTFSLPTTPRKDFSDFQNFNTRNSPSVFPYLVKLNDNGSYHGLMVIISLYPASPRRITVLVNFQAILLIFSGETSSNLYRRRREKIFSDLQNFSTRNSPSVFPYLVKLNDNGSYHGLREPIRKMENHYYELNIY